MPPATVPRNLLRDIASGTTAPVFDRTLMLGGRAVRQIGTDARLVPMMTAALDHLVVANSGREADLTVVCTIAGKGDIRAIASERTWTHSQVRVDSIQLLDCAGRFGVHAITDMETARDFEIGTPMRQLLHWWAVDTGNLLLHSAAVGTPGGGLLLAGVGGSGKSTMAAACLGSSLRVAGDDIVLVEPGPAPRVHSVYSSIKLDQDALARLSWGSRPGTFEVERRGGPHRKSMLLPATADPTVLVSEFPLRAIVLPRVTSSNISRLAEASPGEAMNALAPTTVLLLRGHEQRVFRHIAELVRSLPAFTLELGRDLDAIPGLLASAIDGAS
jgi:hypothetical protein